MWWSKDKAWDEPVDTRQSRGIGLNQAICKLSSCPILTIFNLGQWIPKNLQFSFKKSKLSTRQEFKIMYFSFVDHRLKISINMAACLESLGWAALRGTQPWDFSASHCCRAENSTLGSWMTQSQTPHPRHVFVHVRTQWCHRLTYKQDVSYVHRAVW